MKKKILVISGQTGVGKSNVAFNVYQNFKNQNIKSEIILCDSIQIYKELNLISNIPPKQFTDNAKYHLLNTYSLKQPINGMDYSIKTREIIKEMLSNNVVPILEGGNGFYLKMLETGVEKNISDEEQEKYEEAKKIARGIINYDKNYDKTLSRLYQLDKSLPKDILIKNDIYRLEKRLSDAIFWGENAYSIISKNQNKTDKLDADFYKIFLTSHGRLDIAELLNERTVQLIEKGLIFEVISLIENGFISSDYDTSINNPLKKAFGIKESLSLLISLKELLKEKDMYLNAFTPDGRRLKDTRNVVFNIFSKFVSEYSTANIQYAKNQSKWFRNSEIKSWIMTVDKVFNPLVVKNIIDIFQNPFEKYRLGLESKDQVELRQRIPNYFKQINHDYNKLVKEKFRFFNFPKIMMKIEKINDFLNNFEKNNLKSAPVVDNKINIDLIKKYLV